VAAAQLAILTETANPNFLAITLVLKNRVQIPVDDRAALSACEGNDKIAAIVN
jgi:hypothetical protein